MICLIVGAFFELVEYTGRMRSCIFRKESSNFPRCLIALSALSQSSILSRNMCNPSIMHWRRRAVEDIGMMPFSCQKLVLFFFQSFIWGWPLMGPAWIWFLLDLLAFGGGAQNV